MRKSISRSKTNKATRKRFKITKRGKVLHSKSGRRHLAASKNRNRKRHLAKRKTVDRADEKRVKESLPFG